MSAGDYINDRAAQEREEAQVNTEGSWLVPMAAGLGTIALGAMLLKTRLTTGNNVLANLFNFLGLPRGIKIADVAANTGKSTPRSNTVGIRSALDSFFDVNRNKVRLGPIDIIDDLRNTDEILGKTRVGEAQEAFTKEVTEYINREQVNAGNNVGYFTQGLERITFKRVLEDQETWSKVLGSEQWQVLDKARKTGILKESQLELALDKNIYLNTKTNEIIDFRKRNLFSKVVTTKIGQEEVARRVSRLDMFGQAPVFSDIIGTNKGVAMIRPGDNGLPRAFIGGKVFEYEDINGKVQQTLVAENRILRRVGGPLETIDASRKGQITFKKGQQPVQQVGVGLNLPKREGIIGSVLGFMEKEIGIGPAYSTRATLIERFIINPYKRFRALQTGEGQIVKNEFKREIQTNKVLDAAFGGEVPELLVKGGGVVKVPDGGKVVRIQELSPLKRIGVFFDLIEDYSIVKTSALARKQSGFQDALKSEDLIVPSKKSASFVVQPEIKKGSDFLNLTDIDRSAVTEVGSKSEVAKFAYYDIPATKILGRSSGIVQGVKDFIPYSFYRLNNLFSESLLGFGMKADHRLLPLMARTAMIPVAYETARQVGSYADYLVEKTTGISPIKTVASLYAGLRLAQQKTRELTGIQYLSDVAETYLPGSVNSDGATIARSVVAPLAVASKFLGKGNFFGALAGAFATYFAIGGPDPNQEASDLLREYSGEKKVPVRKGRLWGLGYLPFFGGKPERYDYSWYAKLTSDYKMKSMYGSEQEYWSYHANVFGVPLPTPSNFFGLLNIINPYRLESKNYYNRPYEQTGSDLQSFPVFGPLLAATVGKLLKPTFYRQPERLPMLENSLADRGLTPSHARMLGIPSMNATAYEAEDPETPLNLLARQVNVASEPVGIYKFVMEFFGVKLKPDLGTEKATSAMMTDPGRGFYDMNLGGLFGQTEMLRRFIMSDYSSDYRRASAINTIENMMPRWLPGTYSESKNDQNYFIDFTAGDPYVKIEDGEARLPGPGYEALNKLYSGTPGEYSDVDRFLILADVAPYSAAYKKYEKKVLSMNLDEEWQQKVQEAIENRKEVIGVDTRYKRYEEDIVAMNMGSFAKAIYEPIRKAYDFLTHDVLAEIPYVGSKFFPFRSPYEQYRKMYVEGSEYASWDRPYEDIIRPAIYDIALEDPFTAAGKGAALGYLMSGPMRWFTPFKSIVGQGPLPFNPYALKVGAAVGAGISTTRLITGNDQNMLPSHIEQETEAIDYMDKIAYIKGRMLEEAGGGPRLADKTLVGAKTVISYRAAMPRSADRRYFDYLLSTKEMGLTQEMVEGLPDYMAEGIEKVISNSFPTREESDKEVLDFVNTNVIPDSSWLGWNPEVSASATKLKFVKDGINGISENIHRFGFYESHEIDLKTRLREFSEQQINYTASPMYSDFDSFIQNHNTQVSNGRYKVKRFSTPYGVRRDVELTQDRSRETFDQVRRSFR